MRNFLKQNIYILIFFSISLALFGKSVFSFYTNDDFFFLKISHINTFGEFFNFFSIIKGPDGFGMYRPLSTQVFYFLSWVLFNLNPIGLHIISFAFFFAVIYLVYQLVNVIAKNKKTALLTAFLYSVSATHFAHLYYLATFQEILMTFFVLLSIIVFVKKQYLYSYVYFVLALLSKETAIVTPILILLTFWYQKQFMSLTVQKNKLVKLFIFFVLTIFGYLLARFYSYGFATGDTYIWDFSIKKLVNTLGWYLVWSLNLPETLLDFIGPGLKVNPNLFQYWSKQIIPIFILFALELIMIAVSILGAIFAKSKKEINKLNIVSTFTIFWFLISICPVVFLPMHKFPFYLTLPIVGLCFRIAYLFTGKNVKALFSRFFVVIWTLLSVLTVRHTYNTNWISQGEIVSKRTFDFILKNRLEISGHELVFVDTINDLSLPFSPTQIVKNAISGENFFYVYFPEIVGHVHFGYDGKTSKEKMFMVQSRTLIGY